MEIKQAADGTQEVPRLVEAQVHSIDEVWEMLKIGARNRSVGSTNANELSSRSHWLVSASFVLNYNQVFYLNVSHVSFVCFHELERWRAINRNVVFAILI